ncbi:MAG: FCD domain-containing protein, partial [Candidatus Acidiferrales bacterium]
ELAEAVANPLILSVIDSIVGLLREERKRTFYVKDGPKHGQVYHLRILDTVERHDAAAAREAMRAHLRQVRDDSGKTAAE